MHRRDRIVVSTLRCGRNNPGSNPGHGMYIALLNSIQTFHGHNTISVLSRDRLVVRTLRCGRSNPGSNPGHGMDNFFKNIFQNIFKKGPASAGNRTRINCLEGSYAHHYTTDARI